MYYNESRFWEGDQQDGRRKGEREGKEGGIKEESRQQ